MRTSLIPPTQYENAAPTASPFIFVNTGCFEQVQARASLHAGIYDSSIGNCQTLEATKQTKELHGYTLTHAPKIQTANAWKDTGIPSVQ